MVRAILNNHDSFNIGPQNDDATIICTSSDTYHIFDHTLTNQSENTTSLLCLLGQTGVQTVSNSESGRMRYRHCRTCHHRRNAIEQQF